jgi:glycosyltransferase involved in cell wall biosynthesis
MKVSACICVRNEKNNLDNLIFNLIGYVDEFIIVDGESTDGTYQTAITSSAKVFSKKPQGYVEPDREFCIQQAKNDWVLVLDADELLCTALLHDLDELTNYSVEAYNIPRHNYYSPYAYYKHIHYPDYQLRLFRKSKATIQKQIHSKPIINGTVKILPDIYYIIHTDAIYSNLKKYKRYAKIQSNESIGSYPGIVYILYSPISIFIKLCNNILNGCYKDSLPGLRAGFNEALYIGMLNYYKGVNKCKL